MTCGNCCGSLRVGIRNQRRRLWIAGRCQHNLLCLRSTPESGQRAGFDGHKKIKGSKVNLAVDTLGNLLALLVTPANERIHACVN